MKTSLKQGFPEHPPGDRRLFLLLQEWIENQSNTRPGLSELSKTIEDLEDVVRHSCSATITSAIYSHIRFWFALNRSRDEIFGARLFSKNISEILKRLHNTDEDLRAYGCPEFLKDIFPPVPDKWLEMESENEDIFPDWEQPEEADLTINDPYILGRGIIRVFESLTPNQIKKSTAGLSKFHGDPYQTINIGISCTSINQRTINRSLLFWTLAVFCESIPDVTVYTEECRSGSLVEKQSFEAGDRSAFRDLILKLYDLAKQLVSRVEALPGIKDSNVSIAATELEKQAARIKDSSTESEKSVQTAEDLIEKISALTRAVDESSRNSAEAMRFINEIRRGFIGLGEGAYLSIENRPWLVVTNGKIEENFDITDTYRIEQDPQEP